VGCAEGRRGDSARAVDHRHFRLNHAGSCAKEIRKPIHVRGMPCTPSRAGRRLQACWRHWLPALPLQVPRPRRPARSMRVSTIRCAISSIRCTDRANSCARPPPCSSSRTSSRRAWASAANTARAHCSSAVAPSNTTTRFRPRSGSSSAPEALYGFRRVDGWKVGVDGSVALVTVGIGGSIDTSRLASPIVGFIFDGKGLMYNLTLEGSKISRIHR
jgi:hypothetical protein